MRYVLIASLVGLSCLAIAKSQEPKVEWAFIDLQPKSNQVLVETLSDVYPDSHLAELPQGEQKFGLATFKIGPGCILLGSTDKMDKPAKVDVSVKRKFAKLYVLHATRNGGGDVGDETFIKDGTHIGQYFVRYSDGSGEGIPIVYGEDVRDYWNWDNSKETSRGKIVWTGTSPAAKSEGVDVRLYESSWTNPKPDVEVVSITFSSSMDTPGAPFCIAMTATIQP